MVHSLDLILSGAVLMAVVFGHARWRVSILGVAGIVPRIIDDLAVERYA